MIDEGGQLSRIGNSSVSSDGKIGGLFFAGPTRSVISEALDRPTPGGVGFFAGMSCSTCGGDCATMVALRARVDPAETEPRREREGVFGMGSPAGAGSLPVFVDFLGDAGVSVNSCVESKLPVFLQCLDGSRRSRVLIRRSLGMLWEALEWGCIVASGPSRGGSCSSLKSLVTRLGSRSRYGCLTAWVALAASVRVLSTAAPQSMTSEA